MSLTLRYYKEDVEALHASFGKEIASAQLIENALRLAFSDGSAIEFYDNGQDCCEMRYMVCDDDLAQFAGAIFDSAEIADAPSIEDGDEVHEVQFLRIRTSKGTIVCSNHNEHNGYYGGFSIRVRSVG